MSDDERSLVEQALDVFVYAPLGLALEARDLLPKLVQRGRGQVTLSRLASRYAAGQAKYEAEKIMGSTAIPTERSDADDAAVIGTDDELPIEGYDDLSAPQILPRLEQLDAAELDGLLGYEQSHRARATVINRIRQLQR